MYLLGQKSTLGSTIKELNAFPLMKFALTQGLGAELEPVVKVGDKVKVGTLIAKPKHNMLGANLHSSISGEVVKIVKEELERNESGNVIYIKNDEKYLQEKPFEKLDDITLDSLCKRLNNCGVIGFGGGGYPLANKLEKFKNKKPEFIFINGASSDAYYTADISVLIEQTAKILRGIEILKQATNCANIVIVVRRSVKKYLQELITLIESKPYVYLQYLKDKLCIGDENIIVKNIIGDVVYDGEVLTDKGYMCTNVQTVSALVDAVDFGIPCMNRVITCSGNALKNPCNVRVKIGSLYEDVLYAIGGEKYSLIAYNNLEEEARDLYGNYLALREEYKQDETDEDVKNEMVEMRKRANEKIIEFLKAEKLYKNVLTNEYICGGGYFIGNSKDNLEFAITKTTLSFLLLNKSESNKRNKKIKKYKL